MLFHEIYLREWGELVLLICLGDMRAAMPHSIQFDLGGERPLLAMLRVERH